MSGVPWTEYEESVMSEDYQAGGWRKVQERLSSRSKKQICQKAFYMNLTHKPHLGGRRNGGRHRKPDAECAPYPWPPLSDLDRLGMKLWGFAANTDSPLRPMVRVELEVAA